MPTAKLNYEDKFSGPTRAIIKNLTHVFLDKDADIRHKHMFGHKSYLYRGHVFLLVGEWARQEKERQKIVLMADKGKAEPTLIIMPPTEELAEIWRKKKGGLYFAPGGTRLKNWLSLTGKWLSEEDELVPIIEDLMEALDELPVKTQKNPGLLV